MSHKVHLVARLNVIATNFGYFGLSYVMLMRLVAISSGASSSVGVITAFFLSYLFEVLKYSFLKEKKKEKNGPKFKNTSTKNTRVKYTQNAFG